MVHVVVGLSSKVPEAVLGSVCQPHTEYRYAARARLESIVRERDLRQATGECVRECCFAGLGLPAEIDLDSIEGGDASLNETRVAPDLLKLRLVRVRRNAEGSVEFFADLTFQMKLTLSALNLVALRWQWRTLELYALFCYW